MYGCQARGGFVEGQSVYRGMLTLSFRLSKQKGDILILGASPLAPIENWGFYLPG